MDKNDTGRDRLCQVYEKLNDGDKEKVVRLAEGLLNSQRIMDEEKLKLKKENERRITV